MSCVRVKYLVKSVQKSEVCTGYCCHCGMTQVKRFDIFSHRTVVDVKSSNDIKLRDGVMFFNFLNIRGDKEPNQSHVFSVDIKDDLLTIRQSWVNCYNLSYWNGNCDENNCYDPMKCNSTPELIKAARDKYGKNQLISSSYFVNLLRTAVNLASINGKSITFRGESFEMLSSFFNEFFGVSLAGDKIVYDIEIRY